MLQLKVFLPMFFKYLERQRFDCTIKLSLISILFTFITIAFPLPLSALTISHEGITITPSSSNFTFAHSIWKNTEEHASTFNELNINNYLLIDDIYHSGTLVLMSPLSSGQTISLYQLVETGTAYSYTTQLVQKIDGPDIALMYYIAQPGEYFVEAKFAGEEHPQLTIDFFPDNDNQTCINIAPDSGRTCEESWLPAHYRKEVEPWIRSKIDEIRYRMGQIDIAKRLADQKIASH